MWQCLDRLASVEMPKLGRTADEPSALDVALSSREKQARWTYEQLEGEG